MKLLHRSFLALIACAAQGVSAQRESGLDAALAGPLRARVEKEMGDQELVGLSLGVVIDGAVAGTLHFGMENIEDEIVASDDTMYRWASISKPLTAIVAVQLAGEGLLDLDRDVREHVPEFPEKDRRVTARHLLSHLGGVVHYTNGKVVRTQRLYDVENPFEDAILALDTFRESPLVCEPGTKYSYTTHGYMLLGAVCQRAGAAPFHELVRTRIVEPLGMMTLQPDYQWIEIDHRTPGYRRGFNRTIVRSFDTDVSWKLAGGGWISSVRDLAQLAAGILGNAVLNDDQRERMWTAAETSDGESFPYGMGFRVGSSRGRSIVGHSGSQEKTRTDMIIVPAERCAVVIMCNTEHANLGGLTLELIDLVIEAQQRAGSDEHAPALRPAA